VPAGDSLCDLEKDTIKFIGRTWVLMAQMGLSTSPYNGWTVYAVGRQRQAENYIGSLPVVDSVVIRPNSGTFVYRPRAAIEYIPDVDLPQISQGEEFGVQIYTRPRFGGDDPFYEARIYTHNDRDPDHGRPRVGSSGFFSTTIGENSQEVPGSYGQVVIELFPYTTLRDDTPGLTGTYIYAIPYRVN
jgi:hypothetical protein